ncbi:hypothetical protein ACHAPT_008676 [Fusarium lateritium]
MSRDHEFAKGLKPKDSHVRPPSKEDGDMRRLIVPPLGLAKTGSLYTSLFQDDQFRLLKILPGAANDTIRCRLHVCSMRDNRNAYEALSYCWNADWVHSIRWASGQFPTVECNGVKMAVGVNLHLALRRIRREDSTRVVWADAICIDQSNLVERSQQVAAMGDIFRNAFRVLVWLGTDTDVYGNESLDSLKSAPSKDFAGVCSIVSTWAASTGRTADLESPRYRIQGLAQDFHGEGPLSQESPVWSEALKLYHRPWFERLWVVQEIALAQRATVIWGKCEMSWQWIGLAAAVIRTNWHRIVRNIPGRQVPVGVMNAYFMYRISRSQDYFEPLQFSFCELLALTRQFECQEKRDKIFGLLGLATTDGVNSHITPDYTSPLGQVYRSVACAMIGSKDPLAMLSHVHHTGNFDPDFDKNLDALLSNPESSITLHFKDFGASKWDSPSTLPFKDSWVPKWDTEGPQTLTPLDAHPDFAAGFSEQTQIRDDVQSGRLTVRGIILDEVKHNALMNSQHFGSQGLLSQLGPCRQLGPCPWKNNPQGMPPPPPSLPQLLSLEQIVDQTGHTRRSLERLALTLTAGKSWYGTPIDDHAGMLADFAKCLVTGSLWWTLELGAFGYNDEKRIGSSSSKDQDNSASADLVGDLITMSELKVLATTGDSTLFLDSVKTACVERCLFSTDSAMSGVGPDRTRPGDMICVIYGAAVPFVIRRCEDKKGYQFVGESYVHDLMHGEATKDERYEEVWIELV